MLANLQNLLQNALRQIRRNQVYFGMAVVGILLLIWYFTSKGSTQVGAEQGQPQLMASMNPPVPVSQPEEHRGGDISGKRLVLFYAPWCGHCKSLGPTWDQLAEKYDGKQMGAEVVQIEKVNADENPEVTRDLNIDGFPTVILFKGDDKIYYSGDRSLESLESFLSN